MSRGKLCLGSGRRLVSANVENPESIGIFDDHVDLSNPVPPGNASYNPEIGEYQIQGNDLAMPKDGLSVTKTIHQGWPEIKIVILTAHAKVSFVEKAIEFGSERLSHQKKCKAGIDESA